MIENLTITKLQCVHDTITFTNNEQILDLFYTFLPGKMVTVFFLDPILETNSILEIKFFVTCFIETTFKTCLCVSNHFHCFSITALKISQSRITSWKLLCIPLNQQVGFITCIFNHETELTQVYLLTRSSSSTV